MHAFVLERIELGHDDGKFEMHASQRDEGVEGGGMYHVRSEKVHAIGTSKRGHANTSKRKIAGWVLVTHMAS